MKQKDLETKYIREVFILNSHDVSKELTDIKDWDKETFVVFCLNTKNRIISREIVSVGILNQLILHPREIFRTAIIRNAKSIVVAHNHPSGDLEPSKEDIETTKELKKCGEILGIPLLDHVIVTRERYESIM